MRPGQNLRLKDLIGKTIVVHTITYFVIGLPAVTFLNYAEKFARPEMACWMRSIDDPLVRAGVLFQPLRGLIFALVFYPFKETLFGKKLGWLFMWWALVGLGILSTFGPPPGSIEGMIYTRIPLADQLTGLLEVVPQALLLSLLLTYWVANPAKKWLSRSLGTIFILIMLMPALGYFAQSAAAH